jgi:hypothetical protein
MEDGCALLRTTCLSGYVLPPKNGWVPIYAEGAQFADSIALYRRAAGLLVHFLDFAPPRSNCTLSLFFKAKLVGRYARGDSGWAADRMWRLKQATAQSLAPTAAEATLLNRLCATWPADADVRSGQGPVALEEMLDFFGLPDGFLNYGLLRDKPENVHLLPPGSVFVEAVLPETPCLAQPELLATDAFRFPRVCFGSNSKVTRAMKKLIEQFQNSSEPETFFCSLELVQFRDLGKEIFIAKGLEFGTNGEARWRFYPVLAELVRNIAPLAFEDPVLAHATGENAYVGPAMHRLVAGSRHLWFVLGLLGDSQRLFNEGALGDAERPQRLELFDCVVRWIPEIVTLGPFLVNPIFAPTLRCPFWAEGIVALAAWCGWSPTLHDLEAHFAGDWCRAMVETGVIERDGHRFRVTGRFMERAK